MQTPPMSYVESSAQLERLTDRCAGLMIDVRQRSDALERWHMTVTRQASAEAIDAALATFFEGEPPNWGTVRAALQDWVAAAERTATLWAALSDEERQGLAPPAIRSLRDESAG